MTTVFRNCTIVIHDLIHMANVLIDGGKIIQIGPGLSGETTLDAIGVVV